MIYIADYPQTVQSILEFEAVTRPFKHCIDLTPSANYKYSSNYTPEMYFLEHQKRIVVDLANPLQTQLKETIEYWIVSGPSCIGKSTVARYIAA